MLKLPGFKVSVLMSITILYFISIAIIFIMFNNFYVEKIENKYRGENKYAANVAAKMIEEEKEKIKANAGDIVRDYTLQLAVIKNVNLYFSDIETDVSKIKIKEMDKIGYMRLVSKLKQMLNATSYSSENEKGIAIYDKKLNLIIKTSNLHEEEAEKGDEEYLKGIKEIIEGKNISSGGSSIDSIGLITSFNDSLYLKGIDDIVPSRNLGDSGEASEGIVIITQKIDRFLINKIKATLNKEVVIVYKNKVILSTIFTGDDFFKGIKFDEKFEASKEISVGKKKMVFNFSPIAGFNGNNVGYIGVAFDSNTIGELEKGSLVNFFIIAVAALIVLFIILIIELWILFAPFKKLITLIKNIADGEYKNVKEVSIGGEMGMIKESIEGLAEEVEKREAELKELNINLEKIVEERTKELRSANKMLETSGKELTLKNKEIEEKNDELNTIIDDLITTQKQLVESEKMASLGGLIAGVSSEIYEPLGDSIASLSNIENTIAGIEKLSFMEQLKRADIADAAKEITKETDILSRNIGKALDITQSFRQFAVDQAADEEREFELDYYIKEIVKSQKSKLSVTRHIIDTSNVEKITITHYPGAFYQIITNLISNSIIHGFDQYESGTIKIAVFRRLANIVIVYEDNGKGMSEEIADKIFEPFFTGEKKNKGFGLGMSIVYNIVTQKLKGTIQIETKEGKGTKVSIEFPKNLEMINQKG